MPLVVKSIWNVIIIIINIIIIIIIIKHAYAGKLNSFTHLRALSVLTDRGTYQFVCLFAYWIYSLYDGLLSL
jgi:hypothetical protein